MKKLQAGIQEIFRPPKSAYDSWLWAANYTTGAGGVGQQNEWVANLPFQDLIGRGGGGAVASIVISLCYSNNVCSKV